MVCANVLQWAPSRVTRRGALASDSCCCCCCCISPFASLPSSSLCLLTYTRPPSPPPRRPTVALVPRAPWHADIPTMGPHGRVAGSLLLHKIHLRCSVYSSTAQRTIPSSYSPSFVCSLSFSLCRTPTLSCYHFLSAPSFACLRPWRSCGYQYSVSKFFESFIFFDDSSLFTSSRLILMSFYLHLLFIILYISI